MIIMFNIENLDNLKEFSCPKCAKLIKTKSLHDYKIDSHSEMLIINENEFSLIINYSTGLAILNHSCGHDIIKLDMDFSKAQFYLHNPEYRYEHSGDISR